MFFVDVALTATDNWFILASFSLILPVALSQQGLTVCGKGHYFNLSKQACVSCPPNTYMSMDNHNTIGCINCRTAILDVTCHQAVVHNCSSDQSTVIGCEEGYFIDSAHESGTCHVPCSPCTKCQHEGQKCRHNNDAVCCPQPDMKVVDTEFGPECKPRGSDLEPGKTSTVRNIPVNVTPTCVHEATWKCQQNWHVLGPGKCMRYESASTYEKAVESCASQGASLLGEDVDAETYVCVTELLQSATVHTKIWLRRRQSEKNPKFLDLVAKTVKISTTIDEQHPHVCVTHIKADVTSTLEDNSKTRTQPVLYVGVSIVCMMLLMITVGVMVHIRRGKLCGKKLRSSNARESTEYQNVRQLTEESVSADLNLGALRGQSRKQRYQYQNPELNMDITSEDENIIWQPAEPRERAINNNGIYENEEQQNRSPRLTLFCHKHAVRSEPTPGVHARPPVPCGRSHDGTVYTNVGRSSLVQIRPFGTSIRRNIDYVVSVNNKQVAKQARVNVVIELPPEDEQVSSEMYEHSCDHIYETVPDI